MNADSPLSNIDEVISDSEDDGNQRRGQESVNRPGQYQTSASAGPEIPGISFPLYAATTPQIDYFAGFQGDTAPIPSIAERAKMRQRKTKTQHITDVLELTDDDELMLRSPPSKTKKKPKPQQKPKGTPPATHLTEERTPAVPPSNDLGITPVINARPKVRPKPVKKVQQQLQSPMPRTSQATIPVPTSPFPPLQQKLLRNPIHFNLPPSDPPPTSSSTGDPDLHLPPIAFLPPAPIDSDVSLPSSQPGADVDQLAINEIATLPLPPPTFFAGSSSFPPINALTPPQPPPPLPPPPLPSIIDLSNIPSTGAGPSTAINNINSAEKTKKPRKPRKKKGDAGDDQTNEPQATTNKKARKKSSVTVEIPLPPPHLENLHLPAVAAPKRKGKQKQAHEEPLCEDELNIGPDSNVDLFGSTSGPPSSRNANPLPIEGRDTADGDEEFRARPSASDKRKGKKRKELQESDGPRPTTVSPSKKKKTSNKVRNAEEDPSAMKQPPKKGKQRDEDEEALSVTKEPPKKGKQGDERYEEEDINQGPLSSRPGKGKGRMVITSDDEDDVQVNVENVPSPAPQKPRKRRKEDQSAEAAESGKRNGKESSNSQSDREVLQRVQPSDARSKSPSYKIDTTTTQQRHDTPSAEKYPSLASRYTIAPRKQTPAMSELIRRAHSHPSSPFRAAAESKSPVSGLAYSPYLKASRRTLSRIAPLHPNRRTPPPPLPPPPPKKKSKKELEMEEKWEEEIIEEIGGISEWLALSEREKKDLKRTKRDREMGYCED